MKIIALWKKWARGLRLQAFTLYYAYKNPRTPWYARLWSTIVVAYAFSPIDLIPDFIPVLGYLDDLVLIPLGMAVAVKLIPKDVLAECRQLAQDRIDGRKPTNWIVGGIVIGIWVALAAFVLSRVVRIFAR